MKEKYLIPICIFIVCQAVYDLFAPFQSTNWSIFYFTSQYFAWLYLIYLIPKPVNKSKKIPYFVLASGIGLYIVIELSKIGMDYKDYYNSVNAFQTNVLPIAVFITGLTYFICKTWRQ